MPATDLDRRRFDEPAYARRIEKPWGYELHFTPPDLPYTGKLLHVQAGKRLSLQYHDQKLETQYLLRGRAIRVHEDAAGNLLQTELAPGAGYTNFPGQQHRLIAIEDCDILEVSTPETGNTYRLEDDYRRETETEEIRALPNRGWSG